MRPHPVCPICGFDRVSGLSHQPCVETAVNLVGRLMFRFGRGISGEPWRQEGGWVWEAEQEAQRRWEARDPRVGITRAPDPNDEEG